MAHPFCRFAGREAQLALLNVARLAQLVEHQTFNLRVVGSNPTVGMQLSSAETCVKKRKNINLTSSKTTVYY